MLLDIGLGGADEATIYDLRDWINDQRIRDLRAEQKTEPPAPGRMGVDPASILSVVLGAPAVVALVACVKSWIVHRRPKARLEFRSGKVAVVLDGENLPDLEPLVDPIARLLQAAAPAESK
jgi:Effector Associated Constant Component 1